MVLLINVGDNASFKNVNCQITMPHHLEAKRPLPERGKTLCPQTIIWAHKIIFALFNIGMRNWLSYVGGTFYIKYISLSASVG